MYPNGTRVLLVSGLPKGVPSDDSVQRVEKEDETQQSRPPNTEITLGTKGEPEHNVLEKYRPQI